MKQLSAVFAVMMTSVTLLAEVPVNHSQSQPAPQSQQVQQAPVVDPSARAIQALNACILRQGAPEAGVARSIGADTYRR